MGIVHLIILAILIIAALGILFVVCKASGVNIPGWVIQIFWIVLVAVVAIMAIKFIAGLI